MQRRIHVAGVTHVVEATNSISGIIMDNKVDVLWVVFSSFDLRALPSVLVIVLQTVHGTIFYLLTNAVLTLVEPSLATFWRFAFHLVLLDR